MNERSAVTQSDAERLAAGRRLGASVPGRAAIVPIVTRSVTERPRGTSRAGVPRRLVRVATLVACGLVALVPLTAGAQDSEPLAIESPTAVSSTAGMPVGISPPPTFMIETIVVEGGRRASQKIVASETLLTPGRSYTEAELRQGLQRVARLPFVVEADFSLRRGSERGRYELVISVTEAKPVFFGASFEGIVRRGVCCGRGTFTLDGDGPGIGARLFFGGQSELSAGLGGVGHRSSTGAYAIGNVAYTYHDLFGKHVAGTLAFEQGYAGGTSSARLALPLSRASVLTLAADRTRRKVIGLLPAEGPSRDTQLTSWRASLSFQRDTTDDPFTPRRGSRIAAGISYADSDYEGTALWFPDHDVFEYVDVTIDGRERAGSGSLQASRYWPLSGRLSLGVGASLAGSVAPADAAIVLEGLGRPVRVDTGNAFGRLGVTLLGTFAERRPELPQFWWTAGATLSDLWRRRTCDAPVGCGVIGSLTERAFGVVEGGNAEFAPGDDSRSRHGTVSVSIASRGRWGTVALTFSYRHYFVDRSRWR